MVNLVKCSCDEEVLEFFRASSTGQGAFKIFCRGDFPVNDKFPDFYFSDQNEIKQFVGILLAFGQTKLYSENYKILATYKDVAEFRGKEQLSTLVVGTDGTTLDIGKNIGDINGDQSWEVCLSRTSCLDLVNIIKEQMGW